MKKYNIEIRINTLNKFELLKLAMEHFYNNFMQLQYRDMLDFYDQSLGSIVHYYILANMFVDGIPYTEMKELLINQNGGIKNPPSEKFNDLRKEKIMALEEFEKTLTI